MEGAHDLRRWGPPACLGNLDTQTRTSPGRKARGSGRTVTNTTRLWRVGGLALRKVRSGRRQKQAKDRRAALMRLPKLDELSLSEAGFRVRAHVGWLALASGLPPREKQMHDGTEREAQHRLFPFPFSSSSPADPMALEETSVAASLPELVELGVRAVGEMGTQLDQPWKARTVELFLENLSRSGHRMPATVGSAAESGSPSGRHRSSCASPHQGLENSRKGYPATESETWDQLAPGLPLNERPTRVRLVKVLAGPLGKQMTSPGNVPLPQNFWPLGPAKANVWVRPEQRYFGECRGHTELCLLTLFQPGEVVRANDQPDLFELGGVLKKNAVFTGCRF